MPIARSCCLCSSVWVCGCFCVGAKGGKLLWSALCFKTYASAEFFVRFLLVVQLCFILRNCVRRADMRYGGWVFWPPVSYRRLCI